MKRYDLITPEGTRDLLFEDCLARREVEKTLAALFEGFGYSEVVTPGIEFYDAFSGSTRNFRQESLYKLTDSKGRLIVLRPDSTIPIARLAATRLKDADSPLRLYYNQSVFSNNALLKGRSDEVVQAGIELIGGDNVKRADLEVLCTAVEALASFDKENFRLEIGHIGYFKELVAQLNVDEDIIEEIRLLISSKNFPALNDLLDEIGDNEITRALKQLPSLFGGIEVLDKASDIYANDKITGILYNLRKVFNRLSSLGYEGKISVDLGIVSHTDYYTGIVFKGYLSEVGQSVLKGGRYDNLIGSFGKELPAVGFGVNVDSVALHLERIGANPAGKPVDAVIFGEKGYVVEAMSYAQKLVREGCKLEHSLFNSYEETVEYAKSKGIKKVITVGEEITENNI
ncbi:ATP phosphoribosyltransferase regulatory subunit [Ruminococcus albus]|uniref:ATP phosphoribosyltransferase regulatory subunit n=1 Tax=Ruminococcus albus (strain ATCC 27210 / DSM 20455 / JCM 14654 / NCDO 2250 / 7) TaxID=697329 RepID=E6UBI8_RUMA7|nr:ATP phosphoribosyltransferase regulatory subunit [Ruminococcus albus]ADU22608.1 histidyl-tRNA synthetase 2 [Ruminococcus albus 7 = DSM 20455]